MQTGIISCDGRTISRAELFSNSAKVAGGLAALGVGPGDRVALLLRNSIEFVEISIGTGRRGAFAVPINWHLKAGEVEGLLDDCAPRVIFVLDDLRASLPDSWATKADIIIVSDEATADGQFYAAWREQSEPDTAAPQIAPGSITYTSGTTGKAKGVQRAPATPEQQVQMKALRSELYRITPESRVIVPGPLYHSFPNQFVMQAAAVADYLEIMPRFDAEELLRIVAREKITSIALAPIMFVRLLRLPAEVREAYDLSSLQWALHAGGPCAADVKRAMIEWWGPIVSEYYGGTETGPLTLCTSQEWLARPGTCGRPLADVTMRIVDADRNDVPQGTPGEIYGRLWSYPDFDFRNDPAKRAEVALGDLVSLGDVGYLDEDGYLFLCDRARDMIISGGVNIYPAEIESALFGLEGVEDCAVIGIPDAEFGESVVAFAAGKGLDGGALRAALKEQIAGYKVPRDIVIVPSLERDASGKLRKAVWRERYVSLRAVTS